MKKVECVHWNEGICAMGFYGGSPSFGTCVGHCPVYLKVHGKTVTYETELTEHAPRKPLSYYTQNSIPRPRLNHKGLGDTVKWAIEKVSFGRIRPKKGCGCDKRQSWLNHHFPYRLPKWIKKG